MIRCDPIPLYPTCGICFTNYVVVLLLPIIPISAKDGDNVVNKSDKTP